MKNLPRPEQMEYIRMINLKSDNPTLTDDRFKEWLKHIRSERLKLTKKNNEI